MSGTKGGVGVLNLFLGVVAVSAPKRIGIVIVVAFLAHFVMVRKAKRAEDLGEFLVGAWTPLAARVLRKGLKKL